MRYTRLLVAALLAVAVCGTTQANLIWDVETAGGSQINASHEDVEFNPASVTKVATTWWALERLGGDHRFTTLFGYDGSWDREAGVIHGSLVVTGGDDPDFQPENAFLVARHLRQLGIRKVDGGIVIQGKFWLGWEGGPFKRSPNPAVRSLQAGERLLHLLDPDHWTADERAEWEEQCKRRGWDVGDPPAITVSGEVHLARGVLAKPLLRHLSNPLSVILKRFNVFSNNDIERIADGLGGAAKLQEFLREKLDDTDHKIRLETACGEGSNQMTPKLVVKMLREFRRSITAHNLRPRDLLPVPGCDQGPLPRMFPKLASSDYAGALTLKTGTLDETDGGVAVLAGYVDTIQGGDTLFCVAATDAGDKLDRWRKRQQSWLINLMIRIGGVRGKPCGAPMVLSDAKVEVEGLPD